MNNIWKCCDKGAWCSDTDMERYKHICQKLELYLTGIDDYRDLNWHIKDAMIGEVHFSCRAMSLVLPKRKSIPKNIVDLFDKIVKDGKVDHKGLALYKICGWWNKTCNNSDDKLVCEHVVPTGVYLDYLIEKITSVSRKSFTPNAKYTLSYIHNRFTLSDFLALRSKLNMCIITNCENRLLNKNCLKNTMPPGCCWIHGDPFERYNYSGIKVWPCSLANLYCQIINH